MAVTPVKLIGIGKIFDCTNNVCLSNQAEFSIVSALEHIEIPAGDDFGVSYIPTQQMFSGRVACRDITPAMITALIGGSSATGGLKMISGEAGTVPSSPGPYTVALANAAELYTPSGVTYAPIEVVDSDGVTYEQVAPAAEAAGKFSEIAGTLTFAAADADKVLKITYWYLDVDAGIMVSADPTNIPGAIHLLFSGKVRSTRTSAWKGFMTVEIKKCQRVGELPFGAAVGDAGTFAFDFRATVEVAADLRIALENA